MTFSNNTYWRPGGDADTLDFPPTQAPTTFSQWQASGKDSGSIVADPLFADARSLNFSLLPDSPSLARGFRQIDVSDVGPRPGRGFYFEALDSASYWGHVGVVRVLLARGAKQVRPGQTYTAMYLAVSSDYIEVVKLLLAAPGASDALKTKHGGRTPLKWAIIRGHAEIVALLRAAGAPE